MVATVLRHAGALAGMDDDELDERLAQARAEFRRFAQDRKPTVERAEAAARSTCLSASASVRARLRNFVTFQAPIELGAPGLGDLVMLAGLEALLPAWLEEISRAAERGELSRMTIAEEEKEAARLRSAIGAIEREFERRYGDVGDPCGMFVVVDEDGVVRRTGRESDVAMFKDSEGRMSTTREHNAQASKKDYRPPTFRIVPLDNRGNRIERLAEEWHASVYRGRS